MAIWRGTVLASELWLSRPRPRRECPWVRRTWRRTRRARRGWWLRVCSRSAWWRQCPYVVCQHSETTFCQNVFIYFFQSKIWLRGWGSRTTPLNTCWMKLDKNVKKFQIFILILNFFQNCWSCSVENLPCQDEQCW